MPAVLCSKCASDLPEGAQFCLKCGEPVPITSGETVLPAILGCSKCGTNLPEGAEFCPKCGKPVTIPKKAPEKDPAVVNSLPIDPMPIDPLSEPTSGPSSTRRMVMWSVVGLLLIAIVWVAGSNSTFAQGIQELLGAKHDQTILDLSFSVAAHNFRYYKFSLPQGSTRVSIVGQFTSSLEGHSSGQKTQDADSAIEVFVLSEPAFTVWQNGYATGSVYESGRVSTGSIDAEVPAGAGIYYLVFSNKFSPNAPKHVTATVFLRYKNWLPESLRSAKDRFWNWVGL